MNVRFMSQSAPTVRTCSKGHLILPGARSSVSAQPGNIVKKQASHGTIRAAAVIIGALALSVLYGVTQKKADAPVPAANATTNGKSQEPTPEERQWYKNQQILDADAKAAKP